MKDVEADDAEGVAVLVTLIKESVASSDVTLVNAPQMVAHTLYKVGLLEKPTRLTLVTPRVEEPYGG